MQHLEKKLSQKSGASFSILVGMSTAILLVTPVIILLFLGYFLDTFFHTSPFLMIIGISFGFISGIMNVFRLMKLVQKKKDEVK